MKHPKYLLQICLIFSIAIVAVLYLHAREPKKADLIIFSFDRPMQLYALLESVEKYVIGLGTIQVICRASEQTYAQAYNRVQETFKTVIFKMQGIMPEHDFKPLTTQAITQSSHEYILFAVDDIIVKDTISIPECINALEQTGAYGFFLRLGTHLTACYSEGISQPLPPLKQVTSSIYSWQFSQGIADWKYPHTVDMTLYRKKDVVPYIQLLQYSSPNLLESYWAGQGRNIMHRIGLCYADTKIVNLPLNKVQNVWNNPAMNSFLPQELLGLFNRGMKIDIKPLYKIANKAAHMEYTPQFVPQNN